MILGPDLWPFPAIGLSQWRFLEGSRQSTDFSRWRRLRQGLGKCSGVERPSHTSAVRNSCEELQDGICFFAATSWFGEFCCCYFETDLTGFKLFTHTHTPTPTPASVFQISKYWNYRYVPPFLVDQCIFFFIKCTHTHIYIYTHIYTHTHIYMHLSIYTHIQTCMCVCAYCLCVQCMCCMCVHVCVHVYFTWKFLFQLSINTAIWLYWQWVGSKTHG